MLMSMYHRQPYPSFSIATNTTNKYEMARNKTKFMSKTIALRKLMGLSTGEMRTRNGWHLFLSVGTSANARHTAAQKLIALSEMVSIWRNTPTIHFGAHSNVSVSLRPGEFAKRIWHYYLMQYFIMFNVFYFTEKWEQLRKQFHA